MSSPATRRARSSSANCGTPTGSGASARSTRTPTPAPSGSAEGEVVGLHAGGDLQAQLPGLQRLAGEQRVERGDAAHLDGGEVTAVIGDVDRPAPTQDEVDVVGGEVQGQRGIGAGGRLLRTVGPR